jgi:outer membrane receptor protein involved in Fe transport
MPRNLLPTNVLPLLLVVSLFFLASSDTAASCGVFSQATRLEGVVLNSLRAPVPNARVYFVGVGQASLQTVTGPDGVFVLDLTSRAAGTLIIEALGFIKISRVVRSDDLPATRIEILLTPLPVHEEVTITVSRTETPIADTAASVRVLSSVKLSTTAAPTIDDALRQVPGFQLFRRSGSRIANPTAQGVSLRGVGASGASRALVLADGIPINDPFGGWVYWGRVPRQSLARAEVVRGAASDLYGSGAMGGVIGLITKRPAAPLFELEGSYGSEATPDVSLFTGGRRGKVGVSLASDLQQTDGYIVVPENQRGPVDTAANSRHSTINLRIEYAAAERLQFFASGSYFSEARANGTPFQTNRTHIRELTAGGDWQTQLLGASSLRLYTSSQLLDQNFSAVAADRKTESLTRLQRVPSQVTGLLFQSTRGFGDRHTLISGMDAREVRGASDEVAYVLGRPTSFLGAGGRERDFALFFSDIIRLTPRVFLTGGARFDRWRNYKAHSDTRPVNGAAPTTLNHFRDRDEAALSPQFAVLYRPSAEVGLFASAYRAFRAPTLNELYRSFRVGNVLTLANDQLRAERLTGGEAGASFRPLDGKLSLRGSFFWTEITRPVANVTIATTPSLITRERDNLGRTRSRGIELDGEFSFAKYWSASAGYLLTDSSVVEFPGSSTLGGLRIPQIARHNFTYQVQYTNPARITFAFQGRAGGEQFDDDLNLFRLPGYFSMDAFAARRLSSKLEVFAAAENLFDQRYLTGRTPVVTLGPPRLLRVGFRLNLRNK